MSNILYYSNYCDNCKKLLKILSLNKPKEKVHYICIDNREKGHANQIYIILETQQKIVLPPTVTKVPALLLLDKGHQVLFGEQIYRHLQPIENNFTNKPISKEEPIAFTLNQVSDVCSDNYSFLDQTPESLHAKGDGGLRQMHRYATLDFVDKINTPPDNYEPNTIGNDGVTLENLQKEREHQIKI